MIEPSPVAALLERRTGLHVGGHQAARLRAVIDADARARGCADERAHAAVLREDGRAFDELTARLVVNESYFFRDGAQIDLVRGRLAELAGRGRPVRIWSAGCAAGEEPHTVAMLLIEAGLAGRSRVLGTDLSSTAIARARRATYTRWSLRGVDDQVVRRWFTHAGRAYAVRDDVRRLVDLRVHNLLDGPPGTFDLVLCRNLLMYLSPAAIERAAEVLAAALRPGGWLITGASDPLLTGGELRRVRVGRDLAYRAGDDRDDDRQEERPAPTAPAGPPPPRVRRTRPRRPAPVTVVPPAPVPVPSAAVRLRTLVDSGKADDARGLLGEAVQQSPLDAELRYLAAIIHLDRGDPGAAAREARAALYLDPTLSEANLVLGHAARLLGREDDAVRSYRQAARGLAARAERPGATEHEDDSGHLAALVDRIAERREASAS